MEIPFVQPRNFNDYCFNAGKALTEPFKFSWNFTRIAWEGVERGRYSHVTTTALRIVIVAVNIFTVPILYPIALIGLGIMRLTSYQCDRFKQLLLENKAIGPNAIVDGSLHFRPEDKFTLPEGLRVIDLTFYKCLGLESLPNRLQVYQSLSLDGCKNMRSLPEGLNVQFLTLQNCTALETIPNDIKVSGNWSLAGCKSLRSLGGLNKSRFDLDLSNLIFLESLPKGFTVHGNLNLFNCASLALLADEMHVYGNLDLENCVTLLALPEDLRVDGNLELGNCKNLDSIPETITVGGDISFFGCTNLTSLPSWITTLGRKNNGEIRTIDLRLTGLSKSYINTLRHTAVPGMQFIVPDFYTIEEAMEYFVGLSNDQALRVPEVAIDQHQDRVLQFLTRLMTTAEYKNAQVRPLLARRVVEAFHAMQADDTIRDRAVDLIFHATASCDDGIISALDKIELMVRIHEIKQAAIPEEELKGLAKGFLMLELLNKEIAQIAPTVADVDMIELYLAFHIGLAERLNLPIKTRNMLFRRRANVTDEMITNCAAAVERQYSEATLEHFLETWDPWIEYQRQKVPDYESLPVATNEELQSVKNDTCVISQEIPEQPVIYNSNLYDYNPFITWYRTSGKDPINRDLQIDLQLLKRKDASRNL